jgi:hypothetical protein
MFLTWFKPAQRYGVAALYLLLIMPARAQDCGLNIVVFGADQKVLPYSVKEFVSSDGKDETHRFVGSQAAVVPCGMYRYEVRRSDVDTTLGARKGTILLTNPRERLTLQADTSLEIVNGVAIIGDGLAPSAVVRGRIASDLGTNSSRWVRLVSITHFAFEEVEISSQGTFEFRHLAPDSYVLLLLESRQMLASRFVLLRATDKELVVNFTIAQKEPE